MRKQLGDCRKETVKFRDRRGKQVSFVRRVGPDCPKTRRKTPHHLKPYQYRRQDGLGDGSCSTSPRWVRGGIGFLIGGMLGGMIGGGIAVALAAPTQATTTATALQNVKTSVLVASGITVLGGIGGLAIGAAKPEC